MKNTEAAFHWIINILENLGVAYRISGGFAARVYGANRELADIDIEVEDFDILKIANAVKQYIIFGPDKYKDENWDLKLMTLKFEGQEIDISGTGTKIFNKGTKQWEPCSNNFQNFEIKEVFGRRVKIESLDSLINYKIRLGREVDLKDVGQIKSKLQI